ncbi:hypothetical protein MRX96_021330 [Rhipicephalus microplus]
MHFEVLQVTPEGLSAHAQVRSRGHSPRARVAAPGRASSPTRHRVIGQACRVPSARHFRLCLGARIRFQPGCSRALASWTASASAGSLAASASKPAETRSPLSPSVRGRVTTPRVPVTGAAPCALEPAVTGIVGSSTCWASPCPPSTERFRCTRLPPDMCVVEGSGFASLADCLDACRAGKRASLCSAGPVVVRRCEWHQRRLPFFYDQDEARCLPFMQLCLDKGGFPDRDTCVQRCLLV